MAFGKINHFAFGCFFRCYWEQYLKILNSKKNFFLSLLFPFVSVVEVIPLLAESPEVTIERPIKRSNGQSVVLKTSHLCQWLESAACYYTTLTAQALLLGTGNSYPGGGGVDV